MAWPFKYTAGSGSSAPFINTDKPVAADLNHYGDGITTWGGTVNANGNDLAALGRFSSALQPHSFAYNSGAQSIANASATVLTFDTNGFDVGGVHSTSVNTSRFTIPAGQGGMWLAVGQCQLQTAAAGGVTLVIRSNGSGVAATQSFQLSNNGPPVTLQVTALLSTSPADYIELLVTHNVGSSVNANSILTCLTFVKLY